MTSPFLIANMTVGLERDREPWLLPDEAFPNLEDAYLFRGRITRRQGFSSLGRICAQTTQDFGARNAPPDNRTGPLTITGVQIQPGSVSITDGTTTFLDDGAGTMVLSGGSGTGGSIDYFTGAFDITFTGAIAGNVVATYCEFFGRPVMGLPNREITSINEEQLIGFDTVKANVFSSINDRFNDITFYKTSGTAFSWTGSDSDFFFTTNYLNAFWATNFVKGFQSTVDASAGSGDGIRWYDGSGWINFLPQVDGTGPNYLMGALLIFPYRNRLVMLSTIEGPSFGGGVNYRQRARWCQNGTPFYTTPVPSGFTGGTDANAWRDDIQGKGGFIDAPTSEQIIGAGFINDTLIVSFERSTWQLRYTGDSTLPFIWERINAELGAESTFSVIPFDKGLMGVGNYGIVISNGAQVNRIDQKIPDEVFNIHNGNSGVKRVYGIRDYTKQLVYWSFPSSETNPTFPTRVLIYDYLEGTYAFFNDSLTCFGYFQPFDDITWADLTQPWNGTNRTWSSGQNQSQYPLIVAGNQQGFVFQDYNRGPTINEPSLFITGINSNAEVSITSTNHNLAAGTFIYLQDINGCTLAITGEAKGTALTGTTSFSSTLSNPPAVPASVTVNIGGDSYTDNGIGGFVGADGTINYNTGEFTIEFAELGSDEAVTVDYTKGFNGNIFRVAEPETNTFKLERMEAGGGFVFIDSTDLSAYVNNGLIGVRNNVNILTKRFNPYIQGGNQVRIQQIDFFVEYIQGLEFQTQVYLDENGNESVENTIVLPQTNVSSKTWTPSYYSTIGQFAQLEIKFSDDQMLDPSKSSGSLTIHGLLMYMQPAGRLTYGLIV